MADGSLSLALAASGLLILAGVAADYRAPRWRGPREAVVAQMLGCLGCVAVLTVAGTGMWLRVPSLVLAVLLIPEYRRRSP